MSGPYVDIDDQEYRDGPIDPACRLCDLPLALCDCTALDRIPRSDIEWLIDGLREDLA